MFSEKHIKNSFTDAILTGNTVGGSTIEKDLIQIRNDGIERNMAPIYQ